MVKYFIFFDKFLCVQNPPPPPSQKSNGSPLIVSHYFNIQCPLLIPKLTHRNNLCMEPHSEISNFSRGIRNYLFDHNTYTVVYQGSYSFRR